MELRLDFTVNPLTLRQRTNNYNKDTKEYDQTKLFFQSELPKLLQ